MNHVQSVVGELGAHFIEEFYPFNKVLEKLTAREMMYKFNVKTVCTTDDPVDSLEWHKKMNADKTLKVSVRPAFRPACAQPDLR